MAQTGPPFTANQYVVGAPVFVALNAFVLVLTGNIGFGFLLGAIAWGVMVPLAKSAGR